jgi:hypothetical protein
MVVSDKAARRLLDAFTQIKVVATFSDKLIHEAWTILKDSEKVNGEKDALSESDRSSSKIELAYRPFSITIDDQFTSTLELPGSVDSLIVDPNYAHFIADLKTKVITEIEDNINLRIGKWDILSYLTYLESELKEIRNNFEMPDVEIQSSKGVTVINHDDPFKTGRFDVYENFNVKVENIVENGGLPDFSHFELLYRDQALSKYWDIQLEVIERLIRFIEPRKKVIETTDDYIKVISILSTQPSLLWTKSDTDLLELIIALHESGAIQNSTKDLNQKEAIQAFSDFFGKEIKDQYKKLNAARNRKKEDPGFISKMQKALDAYYQGLNEKS